MYFNFFSLNDELLKTPPNLNSFATFWQNQQRGFYNCKTPIVDHWSRNKLSLVHRINHIHVTLNNPTNESFNEIILHTFLESLMSLLDRLTYFLVSMISRVD